MLKISSNKDRVIFLHIEHESKQNSLFYGIMYKKFNFMSIFFTIIYLSFNALSQDFRHEINLNEPSPYFKFNIELQKEFYEKRLNFREGLILIYIPKRKKFAYMDAHANVIIPPQYNEFRWFGEGFAPVRKGKKWGFINTKMDLIIPFQYDELSLFHAGVADARIGKKIGRAHV